MKSFVKKIALPLAMALIAGVALPVSAQIPSIPNKNRSTTTNRYPRERNGVAYGTQYDWLSMRNATVNDIAHLDAGQVRVLKNSIYARHGYIFNDARLKSYFSSQSWYRPRKREIPASEMNKFEQYNVVFLKKYDH